MKPLLLVATALLCWGCVGLQGLDPRTMAQLEAPQDPDLSTLPDGVRRGTGTATVAPGGFAAFRRFTVDVTVAAHRVTAVEIVEPAFWKTADFFLGLPERIVASQSLDVDGVTGVTYSSTAFKRAVADALVP